MALRQSHTQIQTARRHGSDSELEGDFFYRTLTHGKHVHQQKCWCLSRQFQQEQEESNLVGFFARGRNAKIFWVEKVAAVQPPRSSS